MTKQETFDIVAAHLLKQGVRSSGPVPKNSYLWNDGLYDEGDTCCLYRGPNGLKCAAGCLIPDDKYHVGLENAGVNRGPARKIFVELGHDLELLNRLQDIHDNHSPMFWDIRLKELAERSSLVWKFDSEVPA